ncbi:unnamed protein product [Sphagnum jensenii]
MAKDLEAIPSSLSMQYPTIRELQSILREILRRMKLEHLYLIPWDIQDGTYLDFYNGRIDPRFSATMRGQREINWAFIMHKVIQDEVRALGPKKLCSLPSYLAQLYAYGDCQLVIERHHRVLVRRVIKEVYGTSEDELTDEEEATYEETKEESTEVPLEDYGETEGGD